MQRHNRIRLSLALLVVAVSFSTSLAQQFSVTTKVVQPLPNAAPGEPQEEVVATSITLFHAGKVFDWLPAVGEVTVFEPAHQRFILFNGKRRVATTVTFEQIQQLLDSARDETASYVKRLEARNEPDSRTVVGPLKFQLSPDFNEEFVAASSHLKLDSPHYSYQVSCGHAQIDEATEEYLDFADWTARLNYVLHPRSQFPSPRLELNRSLRRRQLIPLNVKVNVAFDRPWILEAQHRFAWGFQSQERQFIQHWESQLHNPDIKWVSFRDYQQTVLNAVAQSK